MGRNRKFFVVERKNQDFVTVTNKYNDYSYGVDLIDGEVTVYRCNEVDIVGSSIDSVDKWRELGYALPYKGKSIFDMGIAVDKTTFQLTDWA